MCETHRLNKIIKVTAVVVTYNRKILLKECVTAILCQSYPVERLIIIDNASNDGTEEMLSECGIINDPRVDYRKQSKNSGGAGGFYTGLDAAFKDTDGDWFWIMDDDTIPAPDALYELVSCCEDKISFIASSVFGLDGEPMNVPELDHTPSINGYQGWYTMLYKGMVRISRATFVSLLINRMAVKECGLPCAGFFIWGDDTEYTRRLSRIYGHAYMAGASRVIHKRKQTGALNIFYEDDASRIENYYYYYRNSLITEYVYGTANSWNSLYNSFVEDEKKAVSLGRSDIQEVIHDGCSDAIIEREKYKDYILDQTGGFLFRDQRMSDVAVFMHDNPDLAEHDIYLYGHGLYADQMQKLLRNYEIEVKGFIVSERKIDDLNNVLEIDEVIDKNILVIPSVKNVFYAEIVWVLNERNIRFIEWNEKGECRVVN